MMSIIHIWQTYLNVINGDHTGWSAAVSYGVFVSSLAILVASFWRDLCLSLGLRIN